MDIATFTVLYIAPDINSQQRNDDETRAEIKQRDKPSNHESFDDSWAVLGGIFIALLFVIGIFILAIIDMSNK